MRRPSPTHRLAAVGLAMLLVIAGAIWFVLSAFTGHFSTFDVVYADIPASGTGIAPGSVVIFRDITVGTVANRGHELPNGLLRVQLHINPTDLAKIPSGVNADVEIATVFGTQGINLVPTARPSGAHLRANQTIGSVSRSKTTTLQGDATALDNLLNALHPAALNSALTAIATAVRDQGPSLGSTIDSVANYLNEMLPQLPGIVHDLTLLGPVTDNLAAATPPLLSTLANGAVTAQTITANASQLHQLLAGGAPTADTITALAVGTQAAFADLVANSAPLLGDIAANPHFVAQTLTGFDQWSKAFASAEAQGPYLTFAGAIIISGSVQVVAAALGLPGSGALVEQGLGPQFFNPPTYTSADCPRYDGVRGPNCPAGPTAKSTSGRSMTPGTVVTTQAEQRAAVRIATAINHGKVPASPAVTTLLLEPVLTQLAHPR